MCVSASIPLIDVLFLVNSKFFDHAVAHPRVLSKPNDTGSNSTATATASTTLFGPTCDSIDVICTDVELPILENGDWLYFSAMGAYTSAAASSFNGYGFVCVSCFDQIMLMMIPVNLICSMLAA